MSTPSNDSNQNARNSFASRFAANVTRQEEDVRDWLNGDGQLALGLLMLVFLGGLVWRLFFA